MIDPLEAFIALLLENSALVTETDGRIMGTPPGLDESAFNADTGIPNKALVVQKAGGPVLKYAPIIYPIFYLIAYGQTGIEADSVLSKLYPILYHTDGNLIGTLRTNVKIGDRWLMYWAEIQSMPGPTVEPDSKWPVAYATVQAKFSALQGA